VFDFIVNHPVEVFVPDVICFIELLYPLVDKLYALLGLVSNPGGQRSLRLPNEEPILIVCKRDQGILDQVQFNQLARVAHLLLLLWNVADLALRLEEENVAVEDPDPVVVRPTLEVVPILAEVEAGDFALAEKTVEC